MAATTVALQRLSQQRLADAPFDRPEEIVAWFGAVQAQEYAGAKWALGLRMQNATGAAIDAAFNEGRILRTHIMRPTWHFVTPADIRWLMALTAPRVLSASAYMYRKLELDEALLQRCNAVIVKALEGGHALTRAEIGIKLRAQGISIEGLRLTYMVGRAEVDALVCSGPRRGKQFTYALLAERAPQGCTLTRDEALAALTRRYFTGHGPATLRDFAWWSGLTLTDAKVGVEMTSAYLDQEVVNGQRCWFSTSLQPLVADCQTAYLLPTYDEFLVGYSAFDESRHGGPNANANLVFESTLMIGGRIVGSWQRTFKKGRVSITLAPFRPLTAAENEAVFTAVERYGQFLELPTG